MVHLAANAMVPYLRVNVIRKIQHRRPFWQSPHLPLRCEHPYFLGEQVHLELVQKLQSVHSRLFQHLLNARQPLVQLRVAVRVSFILPMGRQPLLCDFIHSPRPDLHLDPLSPRPHHRQMQRLVTVRLRHAHPVPDAFRLRAVHVRHQRINVPTLPFLRLIVLRVEHDSHCQQIINLLERNMPPLHLRPHRIHALRPRRDVIVIPVLRQPFPDGSDKLLVQV